MNKELTSDSKINKRNSSVRECVKKSFYKLLLGTTESYYSSLPRSKIISDAFRIALNRLHIKLETKTPEWAEGKYGSGVLLFGPHETSLEPALFFAMIPHRDVYIMGYPSAKEGLPQEVSDRILPIIPKSQVEDHESHPQFVSNEKTTQQVSHVLFTYLHDVFVNTSTEYTTAQQEMINESSFRKAADLLAAGKIVIIFPTASSSYQSSDWKKGVGSIVQKILQLQVDRDPILRDTKKRQTDIRLQAFDIVVPANIRMRLMTATLKHLLAPGFSQFDQKVTTIQLRWGETGYISEIEPEILGKTALQISHYLQSNFGSTPGASA